MSTSFRSTSPTRRLFGRTVLVALLAGTSSCVPEVRIPLPVPLPSVGGSRPATPPGLHLAIEFGDGVWGQEQERVEMAGVGVGFSLWDRIEFSVSGYGATRSVQSQSSATTTGVRGKVRLADFSGGRASVGLHITRMTSQRLEGSLQNERMTAWDFALPVTFYPFGEQFVDQRWGVYAAPRLVFQTFEDRLAIRTTKGTLAGGLLGVVARWRYFALTGELNFVRTPDMGGAFESGWLVLPMLSARGMIPIGD